MGEILLTSMNNDGTKNGFALDITQLLAVSLPVPVIASGGAGSVEHFPPAIQAGADAVLAASIFHNRSVSITDVKAKLREEGFGVR